MPFRSVPLPSPSSSGPLPSGDHHPAMVVSVEDLRDDPLMLSRLGWKSELGEILVADPITAESRLLWWSTSSPDRGGFPSDRSAQTERLGHCTVASSCRGRRLDRAAAVAGVTVGVRREDHRIRDDEKAVGSGATRPPRIDESGASRSVVVSQLVRPPEDSPTHRPPVRAAIRIGDEVLLVPNSEGRQADVLLRMLDQPTTLPRTEPIWYWLVAWMVEAVIAGATSDLRSAAGCHPAIEPDELVGLGEAELVDFIVDRHRTHALATGWRGLYEVALSGRLDLGSVSPAEAAWLDVGAFARLVEDRLATSAQLARLVERGFPAPVIGQVATVVHRLGRANSAI